MLSHQIRNSASLIDSVDAIRNWRAALLLLATLACTAVIMAIGGVLANLSLLFTGVFALLAYVVLFYGVNAVGMMMMDEARGEPSRPVLSAVFASMAVSHRLVLVFLLLAGLFMAGFVALALILLLCKIPFFGPLLYTVVFPVSVIIFGTALCAVPTVIFPLSAPAVWGGANTMQTVSQLLAVARRRLPMVLLLMIAVSLIASIVGLVIGSILYVGTLATASLSAPILGISEVFSGAMGAVDDSTHVTGYAVATSFGGSLLVAVAFTLPGMVYLRGASDVYLRAINGLDLESEQAEMDDKIAAARAKGQAFQAQAHAMVQKYAPKPTSGDASPANAAGATEPHFGPGIGDAQPQAAPSTTATSSTSASAPASGNETQPAQRPNRTPAPAPENQSTLFDTERAPLTAIPPTPSQPQTQPPAATRPPDNGPSDVPPKL